MNKKIYRLDILIEYFYRGLLQKDSPELRDYYRGICGRAGENSMREILEEELQDQCLIIHDLLIEFNGLTQVDFLLMWNNFWCVIEVKNYSGLLRVENNICYHNDESLSKNQLAVMQNRLRIIKELAHKINPQIIVKGLFILIHPEGDHQIDAKYDFEILTRNQIKRYIRTHIAGKHIAHQQVINKDLQKILTYQTHFREQLPTMTNENWEKSYKGTRCPDCNHYLKPRKGWYLHCYNCGKKYSKQKLALDLHKQLTLLYHDQPKVITFKRISELSGGSIHQATIYRALTIFNKKNK